MSAFSGLFKSRGKPNDIEKLLKPDPANTELLSQKQRLLADSISAAKDKLAALKTAAEQVKTSLANGEITREQYEALKLTMKTDSKRKIYRVYSSCF